jgi:hypothetical protein
VRGSKEGGGKTMYVTCRAGVLSLLNRKLGEMFHMLQPVFLSTYSLLHFSYTLDTRVTIETLPR